MRKINEDKVVESFNQGDSITKIAQINNVSRQCIYNILTRKNVNYKKERPTIQIEQLKEDIKHNKLSYVMGKYNLPYSYLKKIMDEENIDKRDIMNGVLSEERVRHLFCVSGFNDSEIAKIFNCSQYTVRSFRWKHNIYGKNRKWQEELSKKKFEQMRQKGMSLTEISKETGLPYHIITKAKRLYEGGSKQEK